MENQINIMDMVFESITGKKGEYSKLLGKCKICLGTGKVLVNNGPDDVDYELCECQMK